jgi:predicted nucleic acid-binding protein
MIVCLDTNIVIYLIEANPVWTPKATARLSALLVAGDEIAVCDAARLECLVKPLARGDTAEEASYRAFFGNPPVRMLPVTSATWDHAARLAATYRLKAMDSVHLATAIEHGCGLFLTNDAQLARCTAITVEVLT